MTRRRGGRRHAFETIEPARTALVVIDMVNGFVAEDGAALAIVPAVNRLAAATRRAGGAVAWVVPASVEAWPQARLMADILGAATVEPLRAPPAEGAPGGELWPGLAVEGGDLVAAKTAYSAFFPEDPAVRARVWVGATTGRP